MFKGKRSSHKSAHLQGKSVKPLDHTSSDTKCKREVNDSASLMTEVPSRDQFTKSGSVWKTFVSKDTNSPVQVLDGQPNIAVPSLLRRELNPKVNPARIIILIIIIVVVVGCVSVPWIFEFCLILMFIFLTEKAF